MKNLFKVYRCLLILALTLPGVSLSAQLVSIQETTANDTSAIQKVRIDKARTIRVERVDTFEGIGRARHARLWSSMLASMSR